MVQLWRLTFKELCDNLVWEFIMVSCVDENVVHLLEGVFLQLTEECRVFEVSIRFLREEAIYVVKHLSYAPH